MSKGTATIHTGGKLHFLEGIRGLMALNVVVNHFVCIFYPQMFFQSHAEAAGGILSLFASTPLSVLVNGNIAVQYFFVLTGLLVGRSTFLREPGPGEAANKVANRYLRLLPMMVVATLLAAGLKGMNLMQHQNVMGQVANPEFLSGSGVAEPSAVGLLMNLFVNPFLYGYSEYVGPFWTIRYEFFGYLLSLAICLIFRECSWRKLGYLVCGALCFAQLDERYLAFVLGIFLADIFFNNSQDVFEKLYGRWLHGKPVVLLCTLAGAYLACCPAYFTGIYFFWGYVPKVTPDVVRMLGAALLIFAIFHMPRVQRLLSGKVLVWMGTISFGVYGLHMPVMLSLLCWIFSVLEPVVGYVPASLAALGVSLPVIYGLAWLAWRLVEKNRRYDIAAIGAFFKK